MTAAILAIGTAVRIRSIAAENAESPADELNDDIGYVDHITENGNVFVERLFVKSRGVYVDNGVGNGWIAAADDLEPVTLAKGPSINGDEGPLLSTWIVS